MALKKKSKVNSNHLMLAGEVVQITNPETSDVTLRVKLQDSDEIVLITQTSDSKLAPLENRTILGKDVVEDKLRGIGVGSIVYSDSAFAQANEVDGMRHIKIKGISALSPTQRIETGAQVALCPLFSENVVDYIKRGRNRERVVGSGVTAKVCALSTSLMQESDNPTIADVRKQVLDVAAQVQSIKGGRSSVIRVISEAGEAISFTVPKYKKYGDAIKKIKAGQRLDQDDYLDYADQIPALGELFDKTIEGDPDELIGSKTIVFPQTTEMLSKFSAEAHKFLINVAFKDQKAESAKALGDDLHKNGWPLRESMIVYDDADPEHSVISSFLVNTYDSAKPLNEALAVIATSSMPNFDNNAYVKASKEARAEAEEKAKNSKSPAHSNNSNQDNKNTPSFEFDDDTPSFDDDEPDFNGFHS